ncbi:TPA: hypothetical protein KO442_003752 [Clostridioides difficile]|nr:hypothetical protein [Clostridioides difficile]HBF9889189.1 hypothetical protein [Clostridioides difficile]HBF9966001.1 hypothetical protein [Clostridioides difficile]
MANKDIKNKPKNNIRNKSEEYKNSLYKRHETILKVIYYIGNGIMLTDQIKAIISVLEPLHKNVDKSIKELVSEGFLKEKQVLTSNKYSVYLTKYPQSKIEGKKSRDVTSVKPSQEKVLNSLLRTEYFIQNLLTTTVNKNISIDNVRETLNNSLITVLNEKFQADDCYSIFIKRMKGLGLLDYLTEDFIIDKNIVSLEKLEFLNKISKNPKAIPREYIDSQQTLNSSKATTIDGNSTTIEKDFFNFKNMLHRGFSFRSARIENSNELRFKIYYLDTNNSAEVDKLYKNIGFIYLMLRRYFKDILVIKIDVEVYLWSKKNINKMELMEKEKVKSFGLNNYKKHPRGLNGLTNAGVRDAEFKNITVRYKSLNITDKYNIK